VKGRETAFAGAVATAHAALGLRDGPLLRAVLVRGSEPDADRLLVVAHHLVVDTVSWQILVDDLGPAYDQARRGRAPGMPAPAGQFATWARACADVGVRADVVTTAVRWRGSMPTDTAGVPRDDSTAVNDLAGRAELNVTLPAERIDVLMSAIGDSGLRLPELLLGSFVAALCAVLGGPPPMVHVEGHGREDLGLELDVTRTVGWFTSLYPVHLGDEPEPAALVWAAREAIRSAPMSGLGYGLARYVGRAPELVADTVPELLFNYLGRSEALVNRAMGWRLSDASSGPPTGRLGVRPYLLEYHPRIVSGTLHSTVVYHVNCHHRSTVESIATGIHDLLSQPELLTEPPASIRYADAGLTTDELERILARYDRRST
jgi:non-ribosomal peptide synthase protein (TIGR01720 family)